MIPFCRAANTNLSDLHQATLAWIKVMYDCVVLHYVFPSVLSLSFIDAYTHVFISFVLLFFLQIH